MGKIYLAFCFLTALAVGVIAYAGSERDIRQQNAAYLRGMIAGTYYLKESNCTEQFNLLHGNQYRQRITLNNGELVENSGYWSLPPNAPELLRDDTIILHGAINNTDFGVRTSPLLKGIWDYSVPTHAFFGSESVSE